MAQIIENMHGRRIIRLTTDDVISLVKAYQEISLNSQSYEELRNKISQSDIYIPEDF